MPAIRDALYYPYIHIRDRRWLVATLLCFPHVLRMTPSRYELQDDDFVRELAREDGAGREPLVQRFSVDSPPGVHASTAFLKNIEADLETGSDLRVRFSRHAALHEYRDDAVCQIHHAKFSHALIRRLEEEDLVWQVRRRGDGGEWFAMHPRLGEAFMSTIAAFAARHKGLEIVTNEAPLHRAVGTHDADLIYEALIRGKQPPPPDPDLLGSELAQLVIVNHFDLSRLSAADLIAMSRNGEALIDFKAHVAEMAARIPPMFDDARRKVLMREMAEQVVERWNESRASMSTFAKRFFGAGLLDDSQEAVSDLVKTAATGAVAGGIASGEVLSAGAGLAVGVVFHGLKTLRSVKVGETSGPFRYLTTIHERAATTLLSQSPGVPLPYY